MTCLLLITVETGISPTMQKGIYLSCDDPDPGLLQTLGFSTGFANGHYI